MDYYSHYVNGIINKKDSYFIGDILKEIIKESISLFVDYDYEIIDGLYPYSLRRT